MEARKHAILIIRNKEGKFLQYYDERWNSFLFPNCNISDKVGNDEVKTFLNKQFDIPTSSIKIKFLRDVIHQKFSVSANSEKNIIIIFI